MNQPPSDGRDRREDLERSWIANAAGWTRVEAGGADAGGPACLNSRRVEGSKNLPGGHDVRRAQRIKAGDRFFCGEASMPTLPIDATPELDPWE